MKDMKFSGLWLGVVALGSLLSAVGCSGGPQEVDHKDEEKRVQEAKNLRSYFDKANGDYNALSDVDRAAFIQASGGEEKARQNWDLMKYGPSRGNAGPPQ